MSTDLLFYEASDGFAEFDSARNGSLTQLTSMGGWRTDWTQIIDGIFDGTGVSQLAFYDSGSGALRLCYVDAPGGDETTPGDVLQVVPQYELDNWRPGCRLTAGFFTGSPGGTPGTVGLGFTQLLAYDRCAGTGDFYSLGGSKPELVRHYSGWRTSWDLIVSGNFGGDGLYDLLFYDSSSNTGEFYVVENDSMNLLRSYTDWRDSWTQIVPGNFGSTQYTDLVFYDGMGTGQFWSVDKGQIELLHTYEDWRTSWKQIIPGAFANSGFSLPGASDSDLLFYDGMGTGQFWAVDEGQITLMQSHSEWRSSWSQIVPGRFTQEAVVPRMAFVSAVVEPFEPGSEYKLLRIAGANFQASETVTLEISVKDGVDNPVVLDPQTTKADATGHIDAQYSGTGGGVCNPTDFPERQFWVKGTGVSSHRASNTAHAGC
jgi:hypothetical protein